MLRYIFARSFIYSIRVPTEFTDAIAQDWGGKPFVDLIAGWKYILDTYPQV
jgi:hypothetical protein